MAVTFNKTLQNIVVLLILLNFMYYTLPLLPICTKDKKMVLAFSTDEVNSMTTVSHAIYNDLLPDSYSYGSIYSYVTILLLLPKIITGTYTTNHAIIIALRSVSLTSALLTLGLVYYTGKRNFNYLTGLLSVFLLSVTPYYISRSIEGLPDILQLFFISLSIFYCLKYVEEGRDRQLMLTSISAGLAFGTKYAGAFLLPVIFTSILIVCGVRNGVFFRLSKKFMLVVTCFIVTFFITNFYSMINFSDFVSTIKCEARHISSGHTFFERTDGFLWMSLLSKNTLFGNIFLYLVGFSLFFSCVQVIISIYNGKITARDKRLLVLCVWVLVFFGYLFFRVNYRTERYVIPIIPSLYMILGATVAFIRDALRKRDRRLSNLFLLAVVILVFLGYEPLYKRAEYKRADISNRPSSSRIIVGEWIDEHYDKHTKIQYDYYTYIPLKFTKTWVSFHQTERDVELNTPDLIVVNDAIMRRVSNISQAKIYKRGEEAFMQSHEFYDKIQKGKLEGYELVGNFTGVWVYEKKRGGRDIN
jgi:4-amino-4-deoxy-L-arabinose transferase-like glycosyltransferase